MSAHCGDRDDRVGLREAEVASSREAWITERAAVPPPAPRPGARALALAPLNHHPGRPASPVVSDAAAAVATSAASAASAGGTRELRRGRGDRAYPRVRPVAG